MRKMKKKKVVLITGCSSGLGLALAQKLYDNENYRVVATARSTSLPILELFFDESSRFLIRTLDVTVPEQVSAVVNEICCLWGGVDILVNNAGVCFRSVVEHMDVESEMIQLKTNYLGPMTLVRALLPVMREQGGGHVINISSASGLMAMPTMASYSASKYALEGATEALWYEAKPYGIKVTLIQPGFIRSEAHKKVLFSKKAQMSAQLAGPHSEYYQSMAPIVEKFMGLSPVNYKHIADRIIKLFENKNPPLRITATPDVFMFKWMRRLLPASWFHNLIFAMLPGSKTWGVAPVKEKQPAKVIPLPATEDAVSVDEASFYEKFYKGH